MSESFENRFSTKEIEKEKINNISLYLFRHGKSEYKEREHMKDFQKFNPELDDVTEKGKETILKNTEIIASEIDPKKHIIVFLSSPRARALTTCKVIEKSFVEKGFQIYEGDRVVEVLRSGGDSSPVRGGNNEIEFGEGLDLENPELEQGQKSEGKRLQEFFSFISSINKEQLSKKIADPKSGFHGKIPVFFAITHGEVVHGGNVFDYKKSFMGKIYPDAIPRAKLKRGKYVKIDFNLENNTEAEISVPKKMSPGKLDETLKLKIDKNNGKIERI